MSLDAKKNLIFNTFNGLEEQLSDPDPVKEVRNYRWALRQQTILFQNFLNDIQSEKDKLAGEYDKRVDSLSAEEQAKYNDMLKEKDTEIARLTKIVDGLEKTHQAELNYQLNEQGKLMKKQEDELTSELRPRKSEIVKQVRDAVRIEELSLAEKHLRELFILTRSRAEDLVALSEELKIYAKDLNVFGADFGTYLKKAGSKPFTPKVGDKFDAGMHEVMQMVSDKSKPYNTIVEVQECGYTIRKQTVVRAQVVVNVLPNKAKEVQESLKVDERLVRSEVKELIDVFNSGGDIKAARMAQLERRREEMPEEQHEMPQEAMDMDMEEEPTMSRKERRAMKKAQRQRELEEEELMMEEEGVEEMPEEEVMDEETDEEERLTWKERRALKREQKRREREELEAELEAEEDFEEE